MNIWSGRLKKKMNKFLEDFQTSISFDKKLFTNDILQNIAHVKMLCKVKIINTKEKNIIIKELKNILKEYNEKKIKFETKFEDVHMNIEAILTKRIGNLGKKIHTARSRNDQVSTDLRMYILDEIKKIKKIIINLEKIFIKLSKKNLRTIMPGYTHLQKAQIITFSYYIMAYFEMFKRDYIRLNESKERISTMPLGSCALAGTSFPIDKEYTRKLLGFNNIALNCLDAISDRDYVVEIESISSLIMIHLSRLSEDLILWSTNEFNFIELDDEFSTGSSIMPQKKNPDILELIRGKSGRVFGNLMGTLTMLKSLPMAYNKDMQEDKESIFDTIDTIKKCILIITLMLKKIKINKKIMLKSAASGFLNSTDLADYLVRKGIPFREAYYIIGKIILKCIKENKKIENLTLSELKKFSVFFEKDVYKYIDLIEIIKNKNKVGEPGIKSVLKHIKISEEWIYNLKKEG